MTFVDISPDKPKDIDPVIRVIDLVGGFGEKVVLDRVNLDVMRGETVVIMGGSGCGKSTLLRHIIGTLEPRAGRVEMFGRNIADLTGREFDEIRKRFGVLYQSGALFSSMTVGQNVALPMQEHTPLDRETIEATVTIKLELVGLRDAVDLMPSELSGGMRRRAGLARALALDPEILFYDEPSSGLDPVTSAQIYRLMGELADKLGVTSVIVSHDMTLAFQLADRMALLEGGRVMKVGRPEEFAAVRDSAAPGDEASAMVRQFLRGEAEGPLGKPRKMEDYARELLGEPDPGPAGGEDRAKGETR